MKLTKYHKEAFVKAVLDDVPRIDYTEKIRALVLEDSINQLPKGLQEFAKDPKTTDFITAQWKQIDKPRTDNGRWNGSIGCTIKGATNEYTPSKKAQALLDKWMPALIEQDAVKNKLQTDLTLAIAGCTTLKQAQEAFPELKKYLPSITPKGDQVPAPLYKNVLMELAKAGFPKGKKNA